MPAAYWIKEKSFQFCCAQNIFSSNDWLVRNIKNNKKIQFTMQKQSSVPSFTSFNFEKQHFIGVQVYTA